MPHDFSDEICDLCDRPASQWGTGLCSIDRETGWTAGDLVVCPDCAPGSFTSLGQMLEDGVQWAFWDWFWFDAATQTATLFPDPQHER